MISLPRNRILGFFDQLRSNGFVIGVGESADVFRVLCEPGWIQPQQAKAVLRALCCRDHEEWQQFNKHFDNYWYPHRKSDEDTGILAKIDSRQRKRNLAGMAGTSSLQQEQIDCDVQLEGFGAGRQRTVGKADFRFLGDHAAMRQAQKLAGQLGLRLRKKLSRRRMMAQRAGCLDFRRTLRRNIATGGFPAKLQFTSRKPAPLQLVILHDVSHSMTWNNPLLFRFVRGLVQAFKQSTAYAFHTRLFPVTSFFRESSLLRMRHKLEQRDGMWMGGTCIAKSVQTYNQQYRNRDISRRAIVLIISDGFDTDDDATLEKELNSLRACCNKILWLNPMIGRPGVDLTPDGLKLLLPMVDQFLPANSVEALMATICEIGKSRH